MNMKDSSRFSVKKLVLLAMLAAVAYVIVSFVRIPVVGFLSYEPKDVIITIAGFILGPMASFLISFLVSALEMVTISQTGPIGALMNLISTCSFACTAALIYKRRHTIAGAVMGLLCGMVAMIAAMLLWNWLITPLYMGVSREQVEGMLLPMFLPFNALKGGLNCGFTLLLYKPLMAVLRRTGLVSASPSKGGAKVGVYLFAAGLLVSGILLLLVLQGKL
jgi:riboflavin transporter FmnP